MSQHTLHRWAATTVLSWLIASAYGCASPYHDGMRQMARPPCERLNDLIAEARSSHKAVEEGIERVIEKTNKMTGAPTSRTKEDLRMLAVALNRAELRTWERTRRMLAISDLAETHFQLWGRDNHVAQSGFTASELDDLHAAYDRMIEAIELVGEETEALLQNMRTHVAMLREALEAEEPEPLPPMPEPLFEQRERVAANNDSVREAINELLSLLR